MSIKREVEAASKVGQNGGRLDLVGWRKLMGLNLGAPSSVLHSILRK